MLVLSKDARRSLIEREHPELSLRRQCELLSLSRSGIYYKMDAGFDEENANLMNLNDSIISSVRFSDTVASQQPNVEWDLP